MTACHVTEPDDRPASSLLVLPVLLLGMALVDDRRDRAPAPLAPIRDSRHERCPPDPRVLASVVLIE